MKLKKAKQTLHKFAAGESTGKLEKYKVSRKENFYRFLRPHSEQA